MIEQTTFYLSVGRPVYAELLDGRMLAGRLELHDQQNVMIGTEEIRCEDIADLRAAAVLVAYHAAPENGELALPDGALIRFQKADLEQPERDFPYIRFSNYDCKISGHLYLDESNSDGARLSMRDLRVEQAVRSLDCAELRNRAWLYEVKDRALLLPAKLQNGIGADQAQLLDNRGTNISLRREEIDNICYLPQAGDYIRLSDESRTTEGVVLSLNETLQDGISYLDSANLLMDDGTVCTVPLTKATELLWKGKVIASAQGGKSVVLPEFNTLRFDFSTESMAEDTEFDYVREHSSVWCKLSVSRRKQIAVEIQQEQEIFVGYGIIINQFSTGSVGFIGPEFMTNAYAAVLHRTKPRGNVAFRKSELEVEVEPNSIAIVKYKTTVDPDTVPKGEPAPMANKVTVLKKHKLEEYSRVLVDSRGEVSETVLSSEMVSLSLMNMEGGDTEAGTAGLLKLVGAPVQSGQLLGCNLMADAAVFRLENGETRTISGKELESFRAFGRVSNYGNGYGYLNGNCFFHINDCSQAVSQCLNFLSEGQKPLLSYALKVTRTRDGEQRVNAVDVQIVARDVRKGYLVLFRPDEAEVELDSVKFDQEAAFRLPQRKKLMPCDVALVEDLNFYNNDRSKRLTYPVEYWVVEEVGMTTSMIHLADAPEKVEEIPLLGYLSWGIPKRYSFIYRPEQMDWDKGEAYEDEKKNGLYLPLENQDVSLSFERGTQYAVIYTVSTNVFGKRIPRVSRVLWQGRLGDLALKPEAPKRPVQVMEKLKEETEDLSSIYNLNEGERFGILCNKGNKYGKIVFHYEQGYQASEEQLPILFFSDKVRITYDASGVDVNGKLNTKQYAYIVSCIPEGTTINTSTGKAHPTLRENSELRVLRQCDHRTIKVLDIKGAKLTKKVVEREEPDRNLLSEMPLPIPGESLLLEQKQDGKESTYRLCATDGETLFASDDREELGSVTDNLDRIWRFGCITNYTAGNTVGTINGKYQFSAADMESKLQRIADSRIGGWWQLGLLCVFRMDRTQKIVAVARARDCRTFLPWEKALVREVLPQKSRIVVEAERDQAMSCFRNTDNPDDQYISAAMKRENGLKDSTVWVRRASMCWWDDDAAEARLRSEAFEMRAEEQNVTIREQFLEGGTSTYAAEYQTSRYTLNQPERFKDDRDKECRIRWLRSAENPTWLDAQLLNKVRQKNCNVDSPYAAAVDKTLTGGSPIYQDRPERKELWKCLTRQTEDENREFVPGRCAVVWGTRRAGKTTMINQIINQVKADKQLCSRTIIVNIGTFLNDVGGVEALENGRWERNLFMRILRGIDDAAEDSADLADFLDNNGLNTELSWSEDLRTDFDNFMYRFNQCNTGKKPYRIVLFVDEFTGFANTLYLKFQVAKKEGKPERANSWKRQMDFIRFLSERGVVQILVGHDTMMQAMEKLDAVNLNIQSAEKIQVSSLPPDAARELIRAPMKKAFGLDPYDSDEGQRVVEQIQDLTGCFPDLLIKLCNEMAKFYEASGPTYLQLRESDLKKVVRQYIEKKQLNWGSFDYLTEDDGDNLRGDNGADTSIYLKTLAEATVDEHPDARAIPTRIANDKLFKAMGKEAAEEAMDKLSRRDILYWFTDQEGSKVKITFGLYLEVAKNMKG